MKTILNPNLIVPVLLTLGLLFGSTGVAPVSAQAQTFTLNEKEPVSLVLFVPCAGEQVEFRGEIKRLYHITFDGNGGYHLKGQYNFQGVIGVGRSTGNTYRASGASEFTANGKVGEEITFQTNYHFISRGANFSITQKVHVTINPDGTLISAHDDSAVECQ